MKQNERCRKRRKPEHSLDRAEKKYNVFRHNAESSEQHRNVFVGRKDQVDRTEIREIRGSGVKRQNGYGKQDHCAEKRDERINHKPHPLLAKVIREVKDVEREQYDYYYRN